MIMHRNFLLFAVLAWPGALPSLASEAYPEKPIRLVVPLGAGGANDTVARLLAQKMSEGLGKAVVVENRPGGATNIGTEHVVRSTPDGYTLLFTNSSSVANVTLYPKLPFKFQKDIAPITLVGTTPMMLVVHPSLSVNSVKDLIALAKRKPGELTYASAGIAGPTHLAGALFESMANVVLLHVPYKGGGQAIANVIAGQISMSFSGPVTALQHVKAGRVRPLGVSSAKRLSIAPEVPTIAEAGVPGYELVGWFGLFAPAGTPQDIITRLNAEATKALMQPDVRNRLTSLGTEVIGSSPEELAEFVGRDIDRHARIIKSASIKPE